MDNTEKYIGIRYKNPDYLRILHCIPSEFDQHADLFFSETRIWSCHSSLVEFMWHNWLCTIMDYGVFYLFILKLLLKLTFLAAAPTLLFLVPLTFFILFFLSFLCFLVCCFFSYKPCLANLCFGSNFLAQSNVS